jgi:hypothetical protein
MPRGAARQSGEGVIMSAHTQPDPFNPNPIPRGPLDGLVVRVDRPCRCGSLQAVIVDATKGPHVALLRCTGCSRFHQWMSQVAHKFLLKFVAEFGRPTEPVRLFENVNPAQRSVYC